MLPCQYIQSIDCQNEIQSAPTEYSHYAGRISLTDAVIALQHIDYHQPFAFREAVQDVRGGGREIGGERIDLLTLLLQVVIIIVAAAIIIVINVNIMVIIYAVIVIIVIVIIIHSYCICCGNSGGGGGGKGCAVVRNRGDCWLATENVIRIVLRLLLLLDLLLLLLQKRVLVMLGIVVLVVLVLLHVYGTAVIIGGHVKVMTMDSHTNVARDDIICIQQLRL